MTHLACNSHGRRVLVIATKPEAGALTVHRSDGKRCPARGGLRIGGGSFTPEQVLHFDGPESRAGLLGSAPAPKPLPKPRAVRSKRRKRKGNIRGTKG